MEILCFFAGILSCYVSTGYALAGVLLLVLFKPKASLLLGFGLGAAWAVLHTVAVGPVGMPQESLLPHVTVQGYVASLPMHNDSKTQFQFVLTRLEEKPVKALALMSCYRACPTLSAGQAWQLQVTLQKPQPLGNPGSFDHMRWLTAQHITWTGSMHPGAWKRLKNGGYAHSVLGLRQRLAEHLTTLESNTKTLGILEALALGVTNHIGKDEWDLFRRTGTTHLMVISGAHIGLVAGLAYGLARWLWCLIPGLCLRIPATYVASMAGLTMAWVYALLAGFGVPVQRALVVCSLLFLRHFLNQRFSVWQAWRYALLVVLVLEPHSVLMPGFYLSFTAVAVLIAMQQRIEVTGIRKVLSLQLACLVGLMPLTLFWFSYGALNGLIANLLAIPWVGFCVVPLALLITLLLQWVHFPWAVTLASHAVDYLLSYLRWIDSFAAVNLNYSVSQPLTVLALLVGLALVVFLPLRRLAPAIGILLFSGFLPARAPIPVGEAQVSILDVGQGLSVIIRTAHHLLVYDTGMAYPNGSDMGQRVIIPYLMTLGTKHIDKIIISHPDLDHRGGLASLEAKFPVRELVVDDPAFYHRGLSCHDYPAWEWDGVTFRFFAIKKPFKETNNHSCVLQIGNKKDQVLLTGDIEQAAEHYLVHRYGKALKSSVVVVPHHGSKTSSSVDFIQHIAPSAAIISSGLNNRYHFPHVQALRPYQQQGILVYNTALQGMVTVRIQNK